MKFLLGIIFLSVTSSSISQNNNKAKSIDLLLEEIKAKESTELIIGAVIKQYLNKTPNAPSSIDKEINKSIDYSSYYIKVRDTYNKAFSESEIKELIYIHQSGNKELFKKKSERVSNELYDIGNSFGKEAVKIIVAKLKPYQ
jgi:hypothetical protein